MTLKRSTGAVRTVAWRAGWAGDPATASAAEIVGRFGVLGLVVGVTAGLSSDACPVPPASAGEPRGVAADRPRHRRQPPHVVGRGC